MKKAKVKLKALMAEDSDENSDFEKELAKGRFWYTYSRYQSKLASFFLLPDPD